VSAAAESPSPSACRDTPLHYAARNGETDAVADLLLHGAGGAVQDIDG
jgi:hypothetical protein